MLCKESAAITTLVQLTSHKTERNILKQPSRCNSIARGPANSNSLAKQPISNNLAKQPISNSLAKQPISNNRLAKRVRVSYAAQRAIQTPAEVDDVTAGAGRGLTTVQGYSLEMNEPSGDATKLWEQFAHPAGPFIYASAPFKVLQRDLDQQPTSAATCSLALQQLPMLLKICYVIGVAKLGEHEFENDLN